MDRHKFVLLEALKAGALHAGEIRLYRRGNLPGLFAQRTRLNSEVAMAAVRDGLFEVARVETIGKTTVEWVRVTPRGLDYLLQSESPARALDDLRTVLDVNQRGMPSWLADLHGRLDDLSRRCAGEIEQIRLRLDQLSQRAMEVMERIEQAQSGTPTTFPWAQAALATIERRRQVGLGDQCSLADLYISLREQRFDLTIREFHQGLKRLCDRQLLTLVPDLPNGDAPGPEYALLEGPKVYYYVSKPPATENLSMDR